MTIITTPLPPDVEYVLDAALEHGEIAAATHVMCRLYAPRLDLMAIVDRDWALGPEQLRSRLTMCAALDALAGDLLTRLPPDKRAAIALADAQHLKGEVHSLAWCLATWAIEDTIKGGCLEPYQRRQSACNARYELSPRQHRKLYGREWPRHYVKTCSESRSLRAKGRRCLDWLGHRLPTSAAIRAAAAAISTDLQVRHEGYRRFNERAIARYAEGLRAGGKAQSRDHQRRARRIIKRAYQCASTVLPARMLADFAVGRGVFLDGATLSLEVVRLGSSASTGHGMLSVTAVDPSTRARLADLCVYHENTPALDQLTALALAMQAGEEAEIILTANLSRVTDLGLAHPLVAERGKAHAERPRRPRDDVQEKNEAYWQATKSHWIETLGVFTLGRLWGALAA